jgi:hypothetical protein
MEASHPAPVFVLCAPRSFSSVFCAMLGQHPELYAFPELNLFAADTVQELFDLQALEAEVVGQDAVSCTSGMTRVLAELECGGQTRVCVDAARQLLSARRGWSTERLLKLILDRVAPRAGVDKSPRTSMSSRSLKRLSHTCPNARIIHLTREPWASVRSLVESYRRFASIAPADGGLPAGLGQFSAGLWVSTQRLILEFTTALEPNRVCHVRGEDLLVQPTEALGAVARWLAVDVGPTAIAAMLHPEKSVYAWAGPPGLHGDNDPGFLASPALRPLELEPVSTETGGIELTPALQDELCALGKRLGYTRHSDLP